MPELKLVRTRDQAKDDAIRDLRTNWKSIADLVRKHDLSRATIEELQKRYDPRKERKILPIPSTPRQTAIVADEPKARSFQFANASFLWCTALVLGSVGLWFNFKYWYAYGGLAFGLLGGAIDCVTIFLPANFRWQWRSVPPFLVWVVFAGLSWYAAVGFSATSFGDTSQGRESVVEHRKALNAELTRIQAERAEITEDRARLSKRLADHRTDLDNRLHQLAEDIANLPSIATKDPASERVSRISWLEQGTLENIKVFGFSFVPMLAGFLMAFARTLMAKD